LIESKEVIVERGTGKQKRYRWIGKNITVHIPTGTVTLTGVAPILKVSNLGSALLGQDVPTGWMDTGRSSADAVVFSRHHMSNRIAQNASGMAPTGNLVLPHEEKKK